MVTGNTPDIMEYTEFAWYEPIFYYDDLPFPDSKRIIARWIGVAHCVGQALCYWLFTRTGQVIARTSVQKLTDIESRTPEIQQEIREFDKAIAELLPLDIGKGLDIPSLFQDFLMIMIQDVTCRMMQSSLCRSRMIIPMKTRMSNT